jgi:hypothetical protein
VRDHATTRPPPAYDRGPDGRSRSIASVNAELAEAFGLVDTAPSRPGDERPTVLLPAAHVVDFDALEAA